MQTRATQRFFTRLFIWLSFLMGLIYLWLIAAGGTTNQKVIGNPKSYAVGDVRFTEDSRLEIIYLDGVVIDAENQIRNEYLADR